jgi:hypothetical protein
MRYRPAKPVARKRRQHEKTHHFTPVAAEVSYADDCCFDPWQDLARVAKKHKGRPIRNSLSMETHRNHAVFGFATIEVAERFLDAAAEWVIGMKPKLAILQTVVVERTQRKTYKRRTP